MTMITGYRLKQGGFLQADILLTNPKNSQASHLQIPSFTPNVDDPTLRKHAVAGLCQKILIVNTHFAVAFAGNVRSIQYSIQLIDKLLADGPELTGQRFIAALQTDERLKESPLSVIVLSVENDEIQISSYCAELGSSSEDFELYVSGSGSEHAIQHYEQYLPHAFNVTTEDIAVQGTCMALHQFVNHLIDEFENKLNSETIADLFGGGFEVVAYYSGQFNKISDVVYVYAEAEFDADGILQVDVPKFLLKSTYQGNDLKIRSLEIYYDEEEEKYTTKNDRTFTIAPISRYQETYVKSDCNEINLLGEFLCFVIKVKDGADSYTIPFIRKYHKHIGFIEKAFIACANKDNVQITYSDVFRSELQDHVLNFIQLIRSDCADTGSAI